MEVLESLIEYKKPNKSTTTSSLKKHHKFGKDKCGGDDSNQGKEKSFQPSKDYRNKTYPSSFNGRERPKISCFLCEGPHKAFEYLKRSKQTATIQDEEEREASDPRLGSLQLLNAITARVKVLKSRRKGRTYVITKVGGNETKALVDTGATNNFIELKEA